MIRIDHNFYLSSYNLDDASRLAETINDFEISKNTLTIPFPYELKDAEWFLQYCETHKQSNQPIKNWALRNKHGQVCGSIARHYKYGSNSHKDEIGYWLMRPLWGQGLMTKVVRAFSNHCFESEGLTRLEAPIFDHNKASGKVLEKAGFTLEGRLAKAYLKDDVFLDGLLYAKTCDRAV